MTEPLPVYIGFDGSQELASQVCEFSLRRRSSIPLIVRHLMVDAVKDAGAYDRPFHTENGQRIDDRDGKPFSTDFSFSRFLIPALQLYQGWALFCDGDFLWLEDVKELLGWANPAYAVMCVHHKHNPTLAEIAARKMDGREQTKYFRKNWSSLVLWNCAHPANRGITANVVNHQPGQWLHAFEWLDNNLIGSLPHRWNWLSGINEQPKRERIAAVHYTLGGPWFERCQDVPYAQTWRDELAAYRAQSKPNAIAA